MAKSPDNMSAEERLQRIRSLERKVARLEQDKDWAEREAAGVRHWAEEAWKEVRRLHDVCERHWDDKQELRRLVGLDAEPSHILLARYDHDARQWVPVEAVAAAPISEGDKP